MRFWRVRIELKRLTSDSKSLSWWIACGRSPGACRRRWPRRRCWCGNGDPPSAACSRWLWTTATEHPAFRRWPCSHSRVSVLRQWPRNTASPAPVSHLHSNPHIVNFAEHGLQLYIGIAYIVISYTFGITNFIVIYYLYYLLYNYNILHRLILKWIPIIRV